MIPNSTTHVRRAPRVLLAIVATALATVSVAVVPATTASAATRTVSNCGDSGTGSLPGAVAAADPGDIITFSITCPPGSPIVLTTGPIDITTDLTIAGPGPAELAVSGDDSSQVFVVSAGVTATISGITVEDGSVGCGGSCGVSGGGIENDGTLTVSNDTITNNTAGTGCDNSCGANGGGIENNSDGTLTVSHSLVTHNEADSGCTDACGSSGGGIENLGAETIVDSTVSDNTAASGCDSSCVGAGGGIDNQGATSVDDSTVSGNQANNSCGSACGPTGGGISTEDGGGLTVHNSTVADNEANTGCVTNCGASGGGIYAAADAFANVTNSTLSGNSVSGGCSSDCGNSGADFEAIGMANLTASIVANGGGATDCGGLPISDSGYNLSDDGSCWLSTANHSFPDTPAGLDPAGLQDNGGPTETIELEATSPAVDHVADPTLCPPTDQRGSPRFVPCDIGAYDTDGPTFDGSQVHAVVEVETSPAYAGDPVEISSSQLESSCGGTVTFETLQGGTTRVPRTATNTISVILDDDGNVTVIVDGEDCAPGTDVVSADLTVAPYLTALTTIDVEPPVVTAPGVYAAPATETETGDSASSGNSDVYTVFTVETSPVYAEQPVEISSAQLDARCGQGFRWEPGTGSPIDQGSGTTEATGILDDDGNATFVFKGASCAAGPSTVIADVEAGTHPTYTTTFTVGAPAETLASAMKAGPSTLTTAGKAKKAKKVKAHRHHRGHQGSGSGTGSPADPPAITVAASPDPVIETGAPQTGSVGTDDETTLNITKTDSGGMITCGSHFAYTITVTNSGPDPVDGVVVTDDLLGVPDLTGGTYTATGTDGASGYTNPGPGNHNINDTVDLPAGSSITYTVPDQISDEAVSPTAINTATLTPPAGVALTVTSNTSATDTIDVPCGS